MGRWRTSLIWGASMACIALLAGTALVYTSTERLLDRPYPVVTATIPAARAADAIARGRHLADITGCTDCHGADLRGRVFIDDGWWRGRYYASNLTLKAQSYSDEDLARIVRTGVRPDGRGVVAMPAFGYVRVSNDEMAEIIAFVRSLPAGGKAQPAHLIGPLDRWDLWVGRKLKPAVAYVAAESMKAPPHRGAQHERARHLVGIVCTECHGGDLGGNGWDSGAPALTVVRAYRREQLNTLLRTGVGADARQHGLMSKVARDRLHHLTDDEIAAIHDYLSSTAPS